MKINYKKFALFVLVIFALFLFALYANAVTVTWMAPTSNTDGSTISPAGPDVIASYKVEWGTCSGAIFGVKAGEQTLPVTPLTATITGIAAGLTCFRMFATNAGGISSDASNAAQKTILPLKPAPPSLITVQLSVVYQVLGVKDKFALVPVGTVPGDTPCDTAQSVNGFYAVPRSTVSWYGSVKPQLVVTQCS